MDSHIKPLTITYTLSVEEIETIIDAIKADDHTVCESVARNLIDSAISIVLSFLVAEEYPELCEVDE
jgi:DNA-binding GntR family transcriptional regulator